MKLIAILRINHFGHRQQLPYPGLNRHSVELQPPFCPGLGNDCVAGAQGRAVERRLDKWGRGGGTGECQVLDHFPARECRSLARSQAPIREGDYAAIIRERPDPSVAMRQCEDKAGSACEIVWHGCS